MTEKATHMLSRGELAIRWNCSLRKIDRLRKYGDLPWFDLTAKKGKKPIVRFNIEQILEFEARCLIDTRNN